MEEERKDSGSIPSLRSSSWLFDEEPSRLTSWDSKEEDLRGGPFMNTFIVLDKDSRHITRQALLQG